MTKKHHIMLPVYLAVFFITATEGLALSPVVERVGFYGETEPGTGAGVVEIAAFATASEGNTIEGIDFSAVGVSAAVLLEAYGGNELPSTVAALAPALSSVIDGGGAFLQQSAVAGQSTGTPGEYWTAFTISDPGGLIGDAVFVVGAVATDSSAAHSEEKKSLLVCNPSSSLVVSTDLRVFTANETSYLLFQAEMTPETEIAGVTFTARGYSGEDVISADGILDSAEEIFSGSSFVEATATGQAAFSGSMIVPEGIELPDDGVAVLEVEPVDYSGNRSAYTQVFYLADVLAELNIIDIQVAATFTELSGFGDTAQLTVTGTVADGGGTIDITSDPSVTYESSESMVATVTDDGLVTALTNGTATVTVSYNRGELTASLDFIVSNAAALEGISLGPEGLVLDRVGAAAQLVVTGNFNEQSFDISQARFGTKYLYSLTYLEVSEDGLAAARGVGTTTVTAYNGNYSDSITIEILDGPPLVNLTTDSTVVHEKETFEVTAEVEDDLGLPGVEKVQFFVDGNPILTDEYYPYKLSLQAPEGRAGTTMTISAVVTDIGGNEVTAADLVITILEEKDTTGAPIEIISPPPGTRAVEGIVMLLRVTTGVDGEMVRRVEFFVEGAPVGSDTIPNLLIQETGQVDPITQQPVMEILPVWESSYCIPKGVYAGRSIVVGARAYDTEGNVSIADTVIVRVIADQPPRITVGNPEDGSDVIADRDLPVNFSVYDDLNIYGESIQVFICDAENLVDIDNYPVYSDISAPAIDPSRFLSDFQTAGSSNFDFSYHVPAGNGQTYCMKITAADSGGNSSTADIVRFTSRANTPPTVYISSPQAGTELTAGATIPVKAIAFDDGSVDSVELFADTRPGVPGGERSLGFLVREPYEAPLSVPLESAGSTISIYARAKDDQGLSTTSPEIELVVAADKTAPTVRIAEPSDGDEIAETRNISIGVGGFDDIGVKRVEVEMSINGGAAITKFSKDSPPIVDDKLNTFYVNFILLAGETTAGDEITLQAKAEDLSGNTGLSSRVRLEIIGDEPPTVTIIEPKEGALLTMGSTCGIFARVEDDVGIRKAELFIDGSSVGIDEVAPFQFQYPVAWSAESRSIEIKVEATDSGWNSASSAVNVVAVPDTSIPSVSILSPAAGSNVLAEQEIEITAGSWDNVKVDRVEFFVDGGSVGTDTTGERGLDIFTNFSTSYTFQSDLIGETVTIKAVATDSAGNTGENEIGINIVADQPPDISITWPPPDSPFKEGLIIDIKGIVSDDYGVARLDSLSAGSVFNTCTGHPTLDISGELVFKTIVPVVNGPEDPETIGLRATDTAGNVTVEEVTLNVLEDDLPPTARLLAPRGGEEYYLNDPFLIKAASY